MYVSKILGFKEINKILQKAKTLKIKHQILRNSFSTISRSEQKGVNMSLKHLSTGSTCPPLVSGKLRIYAMRFCPYAQRALLTSAAKDVATDVVYVDLKNKPEWIFDKNPGGKVPTVERADGGVIYESLIVADYFDESFPGPQLHPTDPFQKAVDRIEVENFGKLGPIFYKLIYLPDTPADQIPKLIEEYEEVIRSYSKELEKRGTNFFGGNDRPGMLDYMIWPWFERRPVLQIQHPDVVDYAALRKDSDAIEQWVERMKSDPAVKMYLLTPDIHFEFNQTVRSGNPNYNILA